jgi:BirA family transcriptional regulator, biotin operon repressor / biotin---[acetyl-CoA-carboxylase] ligase
MKAAIPVILLRYPTFVLLKNSNLLPDPLMENPDSTTFDNQLIELESVDSTNNYAMGLVHAGLAREGMVCLAHHQWAGKGQRGKTWQSLARQNLMMSWITAPGSRLLAHPFLFSAAVSLGILQTVRLLESQNWNIKWPNDIFWNDRKAAGILIESVIKGPDWPFAVVGIGMNLNQISFAPDLPNAVSLQQITGKIYDPVQTARMMVPLLENQVSLLRENPRRILADFNESLYQKGQSITIRKTGERIVTGLRGVDIQGRLMTGAGSFSSAEIQWIRDEEQL